MILNKFFPPEIVNHISTFLPLEYDDALELFGDESYTNEIWFLKNEPCSEKRKMSLKLTDYNDIFHRFKNLRHLSLEDCRFGKTINFPEKLTTGALSMSSNLLIMYFDAPSALIVLSIRQLKY